MRGAVPVLAYHRVGPGERVTPALLEQHLRALRRSGLATLATGDLDAPRGGCLLTFDDGFAEVWTVVLPLLRRYGMRAAVFAIPERAGEGPPRPAGAEAFPGSGDEALGQGARAGGAHPAFLRWSELAALEDSGAVEVQSHSWSHAAGWVGDAITGFHLGRSHWGLVQANCGDERLGVPLYRRGSALGHRLYFDDPGLRDRLAGWLAERGGPAHVAERGEAAVAAELRGEVRAYRAALGDRGRWETDDEREPRTLTEIVRAREALEARLGGTRDQLCLPWGEYDEVTLACARRAGVRRVYTLERGPNPVGAVGFRVNRFEPRGRGGLWLRSRLWIYASVTRTRLYARLRWRERSP